jgi:hypothetical protein
VRIIDVQITDAPLYVCNYILYNNTLIIFILIRQNINLDHSIRLIRCYLIYKDFFFYNANIYSPLLITSLLISNLVGHFKVIFKKSFKKLLNLRGTPG